MKLNKIYSKIVLIMLTVLAVSFTACSSDDDDTNTVVLEVYGPTPALRGGELRFIGKNLDKVTEVVLPDNISVTEITRVSSQEIKISIPQNVVPGYVTLKAPSGDITSKTKLTFSEPISIRKFYKTGSDNVTSVKAGDEITIEGDYLNLIREVIFADDIIVSLDRDDEGDYPRESLTVRVPLAAKTGKITLSNGEDMPIEIESETDLTVATASVTSITPATVKAGDILTIKGQNLQLVEKVRFSEGIEVGIPSAQDIFADRIEIEVVIPAQALTGQVTLVSYSGLETVAGSIILTLPKVTSVSPNPVKGGAQLTLNGTNLDLVSSILFPNVNDEISSFVKKTATQLIVVVPETAQGGNLTLNLESGASVTAAYTVMSPVVTSTSSPIIGGQSLTLNGTNLDLVSSVAFSSFTDLVTITAQSSTSLTVTIPNTVLGSTQIMLTAKNGITVESLNISVTPTSLAYISSEIPGVDSGQTLTLSGGNFDKLTSVTLNGSAVTWGSANASTMFVVIPRGLDTGKYTLVLTTAGGSVSYTISVFGTGPEVISVWTGMQEMPSNWSGNIQLTDTSLFASIEVGDQIRVTTTNVLSGAQGSFKTPVGWGAIAPGMEFFDITGDFTLDVTQDIKTSLQSDGLIISGHDYTATAVSILHY